MYSNPASCYSNLEIAKTEKGWHYSWVLNERNVTSSSNDDISLKKKQMWNTVESKTCENIIKITEIVGEKWRHSILLRYSHNLA